MFSSCKLWMLGRLLFKMFLLYDAIPSNAHNGEPKRRTVFQKHFCAAHCQVTTIDLPALFQTHLHKHADDAKRPNKPSRQKQALALVAI